MYHDRGTAGGVCEIIWKGKVGSLYIQCECGLINNYILPVIGQAKVSDVNNHFVEKYYRDLGKMKAVQGANNKKNEGNVTPNTVFEIHKILRSCFGRR